MRGWFDSPIESAKQLYRDAVAKWQDMLSQLDSVVQDFLSVEADAMSDPELSEQWATANGHLSLFQDTLNGARNALTTIEGWFSSAASAVGMAGMAGVSGMGVIQLPVIGWIAIVTGATAAGWALIRELRQVYVAVVNKRIAEQNIINSQNGQPLVPYVDPATSGGGIGDFIGLPELSSTAKWAVIGLIGWWLYSTAKDHRHGAH